MLSRCYHEPFLIKNERYRGCTVSEEWKCFQTFANDIQTIPGYAEYKADPTGYQLDKDILVPGNLCYSEETCMFVPVSVNSLEGIARQNGQDTTEIRMNAINAASRSIVENYQPVMHNQFINTTVKNLDAFSCENKLFGLKVLILTKRYFLATRIRRSLKSAFFESYVIF